MKRVLPSLEEALDSWLICPMCKGGLLYEADRVRCGLCDQGYPVVDGIPDLRPPDARGAHLDQQIDYFTSLIARMGPYFLQPWQRSYVERFVETFSGPAEGVVLDCGSGLGYMSIELARMGFDCIACDVTMAGLIRLRRLVSGMDLAGRVLPVCCDVEKLPLKTGIADRAVSISVLEHLASDGQAVREMERVAAKEAGLMISVPLKYRHRNPLFVPARYVYDRKVGHMRGYDEASLERMLAGWSLVRSYYIGHFAKTVAVVANFLGKSGDTDKVEARDRNKEFKKYGANNVACFFVRRN